MRKAKLELWLKERFKLTPAHAEVAALAYEELTVAEIAKAVRRSQNAVWALLSETYIDLGVKGRIGMVKKIALEL